MTNSEFFSRYPESKILLDQVLAEINAKLQNMQRPAHEIIIPDHQLIEQLGICKRTTNKWRSERMITYIKVGALIFYRLSDVLVFFDNNKIEKIDPAKIQKLKNYGNNKM
jgi:hypothetical protein